MPLDIKIAKNYAKSIYTNCNNEKDPASFLKNLLDFNGVLKASQSLRGAVNSPIVDIDVKQNIINNLVKKLEINKVVQNFLYLLAEKARFCLLEEIILQYQAIMRLNEGVKRVEIISSKEMQENDMNSIISDLEKEFNQKIEVKAQINEDIVGGVIIKYDSKMLDCSIKGALGRIEKLDLKHK